MSSPLTADEEEEEEDESDGRETHDTSCDNELSDGCSFISDELC